MAPKKKKSKEELEAERLEAEKEAAKLEEDRIKAEEEEKKRQELEAKRRESLRQVNLEKERLRLQRELSELRPLSQEQQKLRLAHWKALHEARAWERYLSCNPLPHPKDATAMNDYFNRFEGYQVESVQLSLQHQEDALSIVRELDGVCELAMLHDDHATVAAMAKHRAALHRLIAQHMDGLNAWFLHHSDYFVDAEGNVKHEQAWADVKWGIWLNVNKNPRLKQVEFPAINVHLDIQKQLALAPIAIRAQIRSYDEFFATCQNEYMALGNCFEVDLLTLPPACKKTICEWSMRTEGPLTHKLHKLPYPIPPAGADPATYKSEEAVAPLGFRIPVRQDIVPLDSSPTIEVGMWDKNRCCWSKEGISDVVVTDDNMLTFKSTSLAPFSVIRSRCMLLPYNAWNIRPSAGDGGDRAVLTVDLGIPDMPLEFEIVPGSVNLLGPKLAQLIPLLNMPSKPVTLLKQLAQQGMFFLPENRDAEYLDIVPKDEVVERAMCNDIALLAATHLVSSSKWTQAVEADECICRISEVTDWEAGGRTQPAHLQRIFDIEDEQGEGKVLVVMRRGLKGVALAKALNRCATLQPLPPYSDDRYSTCIWGEVHASVLSLLKADFDAELIDEVSIDIVAREEAELKRRNLEAKRQAELDELAKKGEKPPDELLREEVVSLPPRPIYWPTNWPQVAEGLKPHPDTLPRAKALDPLVSETLAQLMFALRLFSFSAA